MTNTTPAAVSACIFALLAQTVDSSQRPADQTPQRPNIIVIISDDAGYADFSMHGSTEFPTPHIDSIATHGVRFTNGYVSASVCSPSRAGLITGRYQQRFGHEFNFPPAMSQVNGLPTEQRTMADALHAVGYRTIALGKWHLGYAEHFHPLERGFDDFFGFLQGSRTFWPIEGNQLNRLLRDREPIPETFTYMTDALAAETAKYIARSKSQPFFIYLSFNAVHTPMHAKEEDLAKFGEITPPRRQKLAAMTAALDDAVGTVLTALREHDLTKNTLVFFINDNGGATNNASRNTPLRGRKGQLFEGGIRVPFIVQWPAQIASGVVYDHPVISLDIAATALAAAQVDGESRAHLDGVDLVPLLNHRDGSAAPDRALYWREAPTWAVRRDNWKLLQLESGERMLFNLAADRSEVNDVLAASPGKAGRLHQLYRDWNAQLISPRWGGSRKRR